jgi:hypothetical protein
MLYPTFVGWAVNDRLQELRAEVEHDRLCEWFRQPRSSEQLEERRLSKGGVLKRLVASLGYTGQ